ncbi:hypothetical protein F5B19DRAFT_435391 [Rostrohypoxylon terebratum]|nr:hypothetical protein F5B19DRAFT_435391 [Rostrohypoxylon terebratum]
MADQPRRRRNRPDSKQMWEESDRRNRHEPNSRDKRDDRGRDRDEPPRERDRDRRYRSRSRSPRRDRDRDRDRDRRDKNRDRRDRDRDADRGRPRGNNEARPRADERCEKKKGGDRRRDRDEPIAKGPARDRSPRRSASPARSPPGRIDRSTHNNSPLPTRPRPGGKTESGSSLQFKVGGKHDEDANRGGRSAARGSTEETEDRRRRTETPNSNRGDAMDEDVEEEDIVVEDDGLSAMQAMMGFGGFGTTKGTHIPGNNAGAVRKEKKTEYRQYMNRIGGFNRPLSPTR